jgi:preprotein translocase subunit SecG
MVSFITLLHIFLCFFLILIILLQPGKDSGAVFGGQAGNSAYAARSNASPLGKATTFVAVLFMTTSISLAWYSTVDGQDSAEMENAISQLEEKIGKKNLEFTVPKLPHIQASALMSTPVPVEPTEEELLEEATDGSDPAEIPTQEQVPTE